MKIIEYEKKTRKLLKLLHGGGLSWWNYRDEANLLKKIITLYCQYWIWTHADSDTPFTTIENNAKELISYIDENFDGTILAICIYLGGQVLVLAVSQRSNICNWQLSMKSFCCAYANDSRID